MSHVSEDLVRRADRAYWDKYGSEGVIQIEDGDAEAQIAMRAALEEALPTRDQIAEALSNATRDLDYTRWETPHGMLPLADAVLALLNGAES